jgi:hypothetical protein
MMPMSSPMMNRMLGLSQGLITAMKICAKASKNFLTLEANGL